MIKRFSVEGYIIIIKVFMRTAGKTQTPEQSAAEIKTHSFTTWSISHSMLDYFQMFGF